VNRKIGGISLAGWVISVIVLSNIETTTEKNKDDEYRKHGGQGDRRNKNTDVEDAWAAAGAASFYYWGTLLATWSMYNMGLPSETILRFLIHMNPIIGGLIAVLIISIVTVDDSRMDFFEFFLGTHMSMYVQVWRFRKDMLEFLTINKE